MTYWIKRSALFGALVASGFLLANCENKRTGVSGADPTILGAQEAPAAAADAGATGAPGGADGGTGAAAMGGLDGGMRGPADGGMSAGGADAGTGARRR